MMTSLDKLPSAGHKTELQLLFSQPHEGWIKTAQIQRAAGELLLGIIQLNCRFHVLPVRVVNVVYL